MKTTIKLLCLVVMLGGVIAFASCSKSKKTCQCTVSATVMGYTQTETVTEEIEDGSCGDLEDAAEVRNAIDQMESIGASVSVSCREI